MRKGIIKCSVINEGSTLKTFKTSYDHKRGLNKKRITILILISIVYGIIHALFKLPNLCFIIFVIAIAINSIINSTKNININIEEE